MVGRRVVYFWVADWRLHYATDVMRAGCFGIASNGTTRVTGRDTTVSKRVVCCVCQKTRLKSQSLLERASHSLIPHRPLARSVLPAQLRLREVQHEVGLEVLGRLDDFCGFPRRAVRS